MRMEKEVDFDPTTMTRATPEDIQRIYIQIWGQEFEECFMEEIIKNFAKSHPDGFTEKDLMLAMKEEFWLQATRELYRLALVDRKTITFNFETGMFHAI